MDELETKIQKIAQIFYSCIGEIRPSYKNPKFWKQENKILRLQCRGFSPKRICYMLKIPPKLYNEYLYRIRLLEISRCCGNIPRGEQMLNLYEEGKTLENIGSEFDLTRERVRQLINKTIFIDYSWIFSLDPNKKKDLKILKRLVNYKIESIKKDKRNERNHNHLRIINRRIEESESQNIIPENYFSLSKYARDSGTKEANLKNLRPDIVEIIETNKNRRWSYYYPRCRSCGTISIKHKSLGYCEDCYPKSREFKEIQISSYYKYRDNPDRKKYNLKYQREYAKRPEVKLRNLEKKFDGNRENAIKRDNSRCAKCGIERKQHIEDYGQDLFVYHLDGNSENNKLNNLKTLCKSCFQSTSKRN